MIGLPHFNTDALDANHSPTWRELLARSRRWTLLDVCPCCGDFHGLPDCECDGECFNCGASLDKSENRVRVYLHGDKHSWSCETVHEVKR